MVIIRRVTGVVALATTPVARRLALCTQALSLGRTTWDPHVVLPRDAALYSGGMSILITTLGRDEDAHHADASDWGDTLDPGY